MYRYHHSLDNFLPKQKLDKACFPGTPCLQSTDACRLSFFGFVQCITRVDIKPGPDPRHPDRQICLQALCGKEVMYRHISQPASMATASAA